MCFPTPRHVLHQTRKLEKEILRFSELAITQTKQRYFNSVLKLAGVVNEALI